MVRAQEKYILMKWVVLEMNPVYCIALTFLSVFMIVNMKKMLESDVHRQVHIWSVSIKPQYNYTLLQYTTLIFMLLINIVYEHYFSYVAASLPIAQLAGIGVVVIVISLPTSFAILVMCYIRRKRLRKKNSMNTIFLFIL